MKKIIGFVKDFGNSISESNASAFAASAAFFMFLSLVPVIMLFCSIIPYTHIRVDNVTGAFSEFIPIYIEDFIKDVFLEFDKGSIALVSVSALITLWVAGKGFWALIYGLDSSYKVTARSNFVKLRIWGSVYTVVFLIGLIFNLLVMVWGPVIVDMIEEYAPQTVDLLEFLLKFRFLYGIVILIFIFQLIYKFVPSIKLKFFEQFPGAVFSALCWSVISFGFSLYVRYFGGFSMYGSLGTVIITLLWLYYDLYILFIGAIVNRYYIEWKHKSQLRNGN